MTMHLGQLVNDLATVLRYAFLLATIELLVFADEDLPEVSPTVTRSRQILSIS